eukprot:359047-Chlamydomonas_euryale.AAC.2
MFRAKKRGATRTHVLSEGLKGNQVTCLKRSGEGQPVHVLKAKGEVVNDNQVTCLKRSGEGHLVKCLRRRGQGQPGHMLRVRPKRHACCWLAQLVVPQLGLDPG